jgi:hypothetical protein
MKVNWGNVVEAVQNGQVAYQHSSLGNPIDANPNGFYDNPMSDFAEGAAQEFNNNPEIFSFGRSQWGQTDVLDE